MYILFHHIIVNIVHLCFPTHSGYEFGGLGSCKGDSGGPLIKFEHDNGPGVAQYTQFGVVQGGVGACGSGDFPSIYVR